jgi:hypothetical protein
MDTKINYKSAQYILGSIGTLGGLYYAFSKNKGALAYLGFALVGGIAGGIIGSLYDNSIKPAEKSAPQTTNDIKNEMAQVRTIRPMELSDVSVESGEINAQMKNFL